MARKIKNRKRLPRTLGLCGAVGALAVGARLAVPQPLHTRFLGAYPMLKFDISLDQQDYAPGQAILIHMRLTNQGGARVGIADPAGFASEQPVFTLTGPTSEEARRFSFRQALDAQGWTPPPQMPAPETVSIEAGSDWEGVTSLTDMIPLETQGEYALKAMLQAGDQNAESNPQTFRIGELKPEQTHIGYGVIPAVGAREGECLFIRGGAKARQLTAFRFREQRADIGETSQAAMMARAKVSDEALEAAAPMLNVPFGQQMRHWEVWREGKAVRALLNSKREAFTLDLPAAPAQLIRPPLQTADGVLDVLALDADRQTLHLARFTPQTTTGRLAWTTPLPQKADQVTAALAPPALHNARHIAAVAQTPEGVVVYHARYAPEGAAEPFRALRWPHARLIPGALPALFVDAAGCAHVALPVVLSSQTHQCALMEARFAPGGAKEDATETIGQGSLPEAPTSAAAVYGDHAGGVTRREAVFLTPQHGMFLLRNNEALKPTLTRATPALPLQLLPGLEFTYVLLLHSQRGLFFDQI